MLYRGLVLGIFTHLHFLPREYKQTKDHLHTNVHLCVSMCVNFDVYAHFLTNALNDGPQVNAWVLRVPPGLCQSDLPT